MLFKLHTTYYDLELIIENHTLSKSLSVLKGVSASLQVQISFIDVKIKEMPYKLLEMFFIKDI